MLINAAGVSIKLAYASMLLCLLGTANDTKVKLQIVNKTLSLKPNFVLQFLLLMQKS
jgi:hypothetical protein